MKAYMIGLMLFFTYPDPGFFEEWTSGAQTTVPWPLPGPSLYVGEEGHSTSMQCLMPDGSWFSFVWDNETSIQFPEMPERCEIGGARVRLRWWYP